MGHFLADKRYDIYPTSPVIAQNILYTDNSPVPGLSSHLNLLEDFNPTRPVDPFRGIPQGLMWDLMDTRNDNNAVPLRVQLNDNVSGYTIQQLSNALDADITSLQSYRARLLSENGNTRLPV